MNDIAAYAGNESAYTKSGRRLAYLTEKGSNTEYGICDNIVKQADKDGFPPELLAVTGHKELCNAVHADDNLEHAENESGTEAPLYSVEIADENYREHGKDCYAAAERRFVNNNECKYYCYGDKHSAGNKLAESTVSLSEAEFGFFF